MNGRIFYFIVYIAGSGLGLVKMLAVASELTPAHFGLYSLTVIAAGLLGYVNSLGVSDAFLPRLNPAHATVAERRITRDSGLLFSTAMSIVMAAAATGAYLAIDGRFHGVAFAAALIVFLVSQNLFNVLMVEVQADGRSQTYATLLTVKSLIPILVIFAWQPGDNLLFFLVLDSICLIGLALYCMAKTAFPSFANFSVPELLSLIRQGASFTGQNAVQNLGMNADKWAIGIGLGSTQLGIYNLAAQLIVCGVAFSAMIQVYFLPQVMRSAIEHEAPIRVMRRVVRISLLSLLVSSILFAGCVVLAYPVILWFYPDYRLSIELLPIAACAGVVISSNQTDLYFRARSLGVVYLSTQIFALVTLLALYALLIVTGGALWMYAATFAGVRVLQAAVSFGAVYRDAKRSEQGVTA